MVQAIPLLLSLVAAPVLAQQVEIKAKPPVVPRPEVITPGLRYEMSRPTDGAFYILAPRVEHDPAFIEPFVTDLQSPTSTGRAGVSGWTSPNTPVGSSAARAWGEENGWFALGFSFTWGGPPPVRQPPAH